MDPIPIINQLRPGTEPLDYERYVRLQSRLRERRRECILFCAHPPTITAGVQARSGSLRSSAEGLAALGIQFVQVGRGGDYTAHEPGQCVIYPHIDLRLRKLAVSDFFDGLLRSTAEAIYRTWGISTGLRKNAPGLYRIDDGAKLGSIGIMFKSFFTSHGVAINVSNNLDTFVHIHPCGYAGQRIGSIQEVGLDPERMGEFLMYWREEFMRRVLS